MPTDFSATETATKTSAYNAQPGDIVLCDPTSAGFTVTLPAIAGDAGRAVIIINTTSSTNTITIDGNSAETINGSATFSMSTAHESIWLIPVSSSDWGIIAKYT